MQTEFAQRVMIAISVVSLFVGDGTLAAEGSADDEPILTAMSRAISTDLQLIAFDIHGQTPPRPAWQLSSSQRTTERTS